MTHNIPKQAGPKPPYMKYTGNGAYIMGIPARDLSIEEFESYPDFLREQAIALKIFERTNSKEGEA